jgi:hypothetical protein
MHPSALGGVMAALRPTTIVTVRSIDRTVAAVALLQNASGQDACGHVAMCPLRGAQRRVARAGDGLPGARASQHPTHVNRATA